MMTEVEEAVPLAKSMVTKSPDKKSVSKAGASLVFFAAFAVFIAARFSAKWVIPRGKRYAVATALGPRVGAVAASSQMEQQHNKDGILVQPLAQIQRAEGVTSKTMKHDDSIASMLAPVTTTTQICTGNRNLPVVRGVDFVAFRSLAAGQPAVYGSGQYSTEFNDYLFFFRSAENKLIFENDPTYYLPAWGGFCSYSIAHEVVGDVDVLGPAADPDYWWIADNVLYLFRSSTQLEDFVSDVEENVDHGWAMWREWFGDNTVAVFNTACF